MKTVTLFAYATLSAYCLLSTCLPAGRLPTPRITRESSMTNQDWVREFPAAITVCNAEGTIIAMNDKSCATFAKDGGADLIGRNVLECHPEPARSKLDELLKAGSPNVYTIEKNGVKKLIYQSPWYENGEYKGFVELSLPLPAEMAHFVRR